MDSRVYARKQRNLHCDVHVAAENKRKWALKTKPRDGVWSFRTSVYFYVYETNEDKFKFVGCHGHNLNADRKRRLFKFINA